LQKIHFATALRLIGLAQNGQPISREVLRKTVSFPKPQFQLPHSTHLPKPVPTVQANPAEAVNPSIPPASAPPNSFQWIMTPEEKAKYENIFYRADENTDNFVTGEEVHNLTID